MVRLTADAEIFKSCAAAAKHSPLGDGDKDGNLIQAIHRHSSFVQIPKYRIALFSWLKGLDSSR